MASTAVGLLLSWSASTASSTPARSRPVGCPSSPRVRRSSAWAWSSAAGARNRTRYRPDVWAAPSGGRRVGGGRRCEHHRGRGDRVGRAPDARVTRSPPVAPAAADGRDPVRAGPGPVAAPAPPAHRRAGGTGAGAVGPARPAGRGEPWRDPVRRRSASRTPRRRRPTLRDGRPDHRARASCASSSGRPARASRRCCGPSTGSCPTSPAAALGRGARRRALDPGPPAPRARRRRRGGGPGPAASFVTDTVEDELAYAMENLGVAPTPCAGGSRTPSTCSACTSSRDRPLPTLSGGQQQRVAIGAVLTASPAGPRPRRAHLGARPGRGRGGAGRADPAGARPRHDGA